MPWMMPTPYAARGPGGCFIGGWWEDGIVANNDLTHLRLDDQFEACRRAVVPRAPEYRAQDLGAQHDQCTPHGTLENLIRSLGQYHSKPNRDGAKHGDDGRVSQSI